MTPDLDTPLWLTLTIAGLVWGTLGIVCLVLFRRRKGDHYDRADQHRADYSALRSGPAVPARDDEPADGHRVVHGHHGSRLGGDRDRNAGAAGPTRLALSDDELVALARYHHAALAHAPRGYGKTVLRAALVKIEQAAERVGRR